MYNTHTSKSTKFAGKKGAKTAAFKKNYSYSDYWMNDGYSSVSSKFSGLSDKSNKSNDLVKLIKLSNYRRAITNFVKILTNREIPVTWAGSNSYTDGKSINLSTDIKDNNFDVTVGLALHEASHVILTDFNTLPALNSRSLSHVEDMIESYGTDLYIVCTDPRAVLRNLLNWIEDRRIDNYVFTTSPGYKAYYHKLYDHYWNDPVVLRGIQSSKYRQMTMDNYMFHIINMISSGSDLKALPGLDKIAKLIDMPNISRLNSTSESLIVSVEVFRVIIDELLAAPKKQVKTTDKEEESTAPSKTKGKSKQQAEGTKEGTEEDQDEPTASDDTQADEEAAEEESGNDEEGDDNEGIELTPSEELAIKKAIEQQEKFLEGKTGKKTANKALQKKLDSVAASDIEMQEVGEGNYKTNALILDLTKASAMETYVNYNEIYKKLYEQLRNAQGEDYKNIQMQISELERLDSAINKYVSRRTDVRSEKAIAKGFEMGGLLGKKLLLHNETRERQDVRLQTGKIDAKRLAHAGYGIENIFKQVNISQHRKANLHISLDYSGSMGGEKWQAAVQMTAAIVKAITYTQGINVQVGLRTTTSGPSCNPLYLTVYDSTKNNLRHFATVLSRVECMDTTPEGLCFEALIKKNMLKKGTSAMDSYFLNISDGEPYMGGRIDYSGRQAVDHTRAQVNKMKTNLNMKVLSFFLSESWTIMNDFQSTDIGSKFIHMYGQGAAAVDPNSAISIAKEMNNKFMQN